MNMVELSSVIINKGILSSVEDDDFFIANGMLRLKSNANTVRLVGLVSSGLWALAVRIAFYCVTVMRQTTKLKKLCTL